jgi:hypothetical protein
MAAMQNLFSIMPQVRIHGGPYASAALHQRGDESDVAPQTVKFGDYERGLAPPAFLQDRK